MKSALRRSLLDLLIAALFAAAEMIALAETKWTTIDSFQLVYGQSGTAGDVGANDAGTQLYAVGSAALTPQSSAAVIRVSSDAGRNWTTSDTFSIPNGGTDFHFRGFAAAPNGSLFASGEAFKFLSGKNWIIRKSADQGVTWSTCDYLTDWQFYPSAGDIKVAPSGEIYAAGTFGGTCCDEWRLSAFQWFVRKSSDDGMTWRTVDNLGSLMPYNFSEARAVAFSGTAILVAGYLSSSPDWYGIEAWTVRRSLDGGASWSNVDSYQVELGRASEANAMVVTPNGQIFVAGSAAGGSGGSRVGYWIVRRSNDGGLSWETVDSLVNPENQALTPVGLTVDPAGRIWVCGYSTLNGVENGWLVRRGITTPDGSMEWSNSDFVEGRFARANGIWSDRQGQILVSGRVASNESTAFATRALSPKAAAETPIEDPFTPGNPSPFPGLPINVAQSGESLVVSWPAVFKSAFLEYSDVVPAAEWKPIQVLPFQIGSDKVILLDLAVQRRFFRLHQR